MFPRLTLGFQCLIAVVFLAIGGASGATPTVDPSGVLVDMGATIFDSKTRRSWLDLSVSGGLSYDDLKEMGCNPTCVTGPLAGWTFAQAGDVQQLVEDAGLPYNKDIKDFDLDPNLLDFRTRELKSLIQLLGGSVTCLPTDTEYYYCSGQAARVKLVVA